MDGDSIVHHLLHYGLGSIHYTSLRVLHGWRFHCTSFTTLGTWEYSLYFFEGTAWMEIPLYIIYYIRDLGVFTISTR